MFSRQKAIVFALLLMVSGFAQAKKMDLDTHNLVIQKFEAAIKNLNRQDPTRPGVANRLGDLYAERARLKELKEGEKSCQNCFGSQADRNKAIAYYTEAYSRLRGSRKESVLVQLAHLYSLSGLEKKAESLFITVLNGGTASYSNGLVAHANIGMGNIAFSRGQFGKALNHFEAALRFDELNRPGYATYRKAWCLLNLGAQEKAMKTLMSILQTPELLMAGQGENRKIDQAFHRDVSRDLATFIARQSISSSEIEMLIELSPADAGKDNLYYLGEETDRLGNKQASLMVWSRYLEFKTTAAERLEVQIRVAQLNYDLGDKEQAVAGLEAAIQMWQTKGCTDKVNCEMHKQRMRSFVTEWNRSEGKKVTPTLLRAYTAYTSLFKTDMDMVFRGALVARSLQNWNVAIKMYRDGSYLGRDALKRNSKDKDEAAKAKKIFEASLLGEIEVAELTKNPELRLNAYNHYLSMNPKGSRVVEVSYQRAMVFYEQKNYKSAAEHFIAVAMLPSQADAGLNKRAADLALDSLVLLKNEDLIEKYALQFSNRFAQHRVEFVTIARKSVLRQTADVIDGKNEDLSQVRSALKKLNQVDLLGASHQEKVALFKNKIKLGQKAEDLRAVEVAAIGLYALPGVSASDKEFALERQAWVAEMQLEFGKALRINQQMSLGNLSEEQRLLKLALLADLAGGNSDRYYDKFIMTTRDTHQANEIRARKIRNSNNLWAAFFRNIRIMRESPDIVAPLALELYARTKDARQANDFLSRNVASRHPATSTLRRLLFLRQFEGLDSKVKRHDIVTANNALMQRSLKTRLDLIAELEAQGAQAVNMRDWTLQLVTVQSIAREYERLYEDLKDLPAPKNLKEDQLKQYKALLAERANPYKEKAEKLEDKVRDFWNNDSAIEGLIADYSKAPSRILPALQDELNALRRIAPADIQRKIARGFASQPDRPTRSELINARNEVRERPFDVRSAEKLKAIEQANGGETMVAYLNARLGQMRKAN